MQPMISPEIENSIIKFLTKSANSEELDLLNSWIQKKEHQTIFYNYVETQFAIEFAMNNPDQKEIQERLLELMRKDKKIVNRFKLPSVFKYAAIAIFFLGLGYYLKNQVAISDKIETIVPKQDAITLEIENGELIILSENGTTDIVSATGKVIGKKREKELTYSKNNESSLIYNTLNVPFGKRFNITLSDGSNVFLNSGSSLKYPVNFIKDMSRQVYLEGEAYFQVAHDKSLPFVVTAQGIDVEVLGTSFNMSNYPENQDTEIVLVEGSVQLSANKMKTKSNEENVIALEPGFKGSVDRETKLISTEKVNTAMYTSWMQGNVVFRGVSFENITKKLERIYNVTIINNNQSLAKERFNATIEADKETINQVFRYFNKVYQIDYSIVENKIVIN